MVCLVLLGQPVAKALTFGNVVMGGGGYVTGIIACPAQTNLFYCKTDVGGAYRWDEPTQSWIPLLDWNSQNETTYQGVESMAVDPQSQRCASTIGYDIGHEHVAAPRRKDRASCP